MTDRRKLAAVRVGPRNIPSNHISMLTTEAALRWLDERGGEGMFDRNGVLLAAGESAPHVRRTWNMLAGLGLVEFYKPGGKGRGRMRLTDTGREAARRGL